MGLTGVFGAGTGWRRERGQGFQGGKFGWAFGGWEAGEARWRGTRGFWTSMAVPRPPRPPEETAWAVPTKPFCRWVSEWLLLSRT